MIEWIDDLHHYALKTPPAPDIPAAYSELVNALIDARRIKDDAQLLMGDMLIGKETIYAEATIAGLAADVGLSPQSLYDYRDVAAFYPVDVRARYRGSLSYSHLKLAKKLGTLDQAQDFLDACVRNVWSVAAAQLEIKHVAGERVPAMPVFKGTCVFRVVDGRVMVEGLEGTMMQEGRGYSVLIREERE